MTDVATLDLYAFRGTRNFGDALAVDLLGGKLTRSVRIVDDLDKATMVSIGTLFRQGDGYLYGTKKSASGMLPRVAVFGTGFRNPVIPDGELHRYFDLDIYALRGKLTEDVMRKVGYLSDNDHPVLGDPGLLYPDLAPNWRQIPKTYDFAVVPHYYDQTSGRKLVEDLQAQGYSVKFINVSADDSVSVVRYIAASRAVISSSLHGLIVADAMGIPNRRVIFGDISSDAKRANAMPDFKYADYYSAFDAIPPPALRINNDDGSVKLTFDDVFSPIPFAEVEARKVQLRAALEELKQRAGSYGMIKDPLRVLIAANSGANRITANTFIATLSEALKRTGAEVDCGVDRFWNAALGSYDVVHLQWPEALIGWSGEKATDELLSRLRHRLAELKAAGTKIVYTRHNRKPHTLSGENITKLTEIFETGADAIVHMGATSKNECLEAYPNSAVRHVVIPHHLKEEIEFSISRAEARAKLGIAADAKVMLSFGAFRHEEEIALVKDAVNGLDVPNFKLLAPLCPGDTYKGPVPDDELPAYFAAADIVFLQRVKVLNSGVLPLAYDAARVCVGPSDGNVGEILANTANPTFDPSDYASVVAAIKQGFVLAAEGKGERNRVYAREHWNPDCIAKMMLAFYQDILAGSSSPNMEFWNPVCCRDVIYVRCPRALLAKKDKLSFSDVVRVRNRIYEHQMRGRKIVYTGQGETPQGNVDAVEKELNRLFEEESDLAVHAGGSTSESFVSKRCRVLKVAFVDIGNMGDQLNRLIMRKVFGYEVLSVPAPEAVMSGIGSHLGSTVAGKNCDYPISVWGTGFGSNGGFRVSPDRSFDIRAVRGELSRQRLEAALGRKLEIPTGDGGLLAPYLLDSPVEKKHKLGIIPHFKDRDNPIFKKLESLTDDFLRIDLTDDPLMVVKQIASCDTIITNSLHGLIVSDSFGVPNLHVKIASKMLGDGFKFEDYYSSYEMKDGFLDLEQEDVPSLDFVRSHYKVPRKLVLQKQQDLIDCFPFPRRESIDDNQAAKELARFLSDEHRLVSLAMTSPTDNNFVDSLQKMKSERQADKAKIEELRGDVRKLLGTRERLVSERQADKAKIEELRGDIRKLLGARERLASERHADKAKIEEI